MKLGLGTVQFGLDYGISNPDGRTVEGEVAEILDMAARRGLRVLDTAPLYGTSEEVLGRTLPAGHRFRIVTKTAKFGTGPITSRDARELEETFRRSLDLMRQESLYGLLVHDADNLLAPDGRLLMDRMVSLREQGLVKKIGVSVYTSRQIERVLDAFGIDIVQLPINVLDQRLLQGGHLARLKAAGVEIHARSAFLQGLLLMDPAALPRYFDPVRKHLQHYRDFLRERGVSPLQAAVGFVSALAETDAVICGVNNRQQLEELCEASACSVEIDLTQFAFDDETILNPSKWRINT